MPAPVIALSRAAKAVVPVLVGVSLAGMVAIAVTPRSPHVVRSASRTLRPMDIAPAAPATPEPATLASLSGAGIVAAVKAGGVTHVLSVPDLHTSQGVLARVAADPELTLIRVCKEDEAIGIAAGLSYGDRRALVLIQYTGFMYAINAIRGIACEQQLPIVLMIGLLSKEPDVAPTASKRFGVRITEPLLDVLGIEHHYIDTDADLDRIAPIIESAYATPKPVALLIGRRPG